MTVSEIHHVAVIVADLERSADFYEQALGWRRTLRSDVGGELIERSLHLGAGVTGRVQYLQGPSRLGQLELIEWSDGPGPAPRNGYAPLGPFLLSFQVGRDELDGVYARVAEMGAEVLSEPVVSVLEHYGPIGAFCFRDPDGNLLEIVALPSREEIEAFRGCQQPT